MSLIKQLWIAIAIVMTLAFGGSLVVSTLSARHYLAQQLQVKNHDNATSLALSLSQLPKDPVTVDLQIAAQFDAGHYRLIRLTSPTGEVIAEREYRDPLPGAPLWFERLIQLDTHPGVSQVQDGWRQFGTLTVDSHKRYAYEALWSGTLHLLLWFLLGAAVTGLIGTFIIKIITRPLGRVVAQAEAIGGRRFITTEEPRTREFRSVVRAMNALAERVRAMLAEEAQRLEQLRRQNQHDELTGLINRKQFMNLLDAALARDDAQATGTLVLVRLGDLPELNRRLGHAGTDAVLRSIGLALHDFAATRNEAASGRIGGSDFALLAPTAYDTAQLTVELAAAVHAALDAQPAGEALRVAVAAGRYAAGDTRAALLSRIDGALARAEQSADRAVQLADSAANAAPFTDLQAWRNALIGALGGQGLRLGRFPVVNGEGRALHHEAPMRLLLDGEWRNAGYFMAWAARLDLMTTLDLAVARAALAEIARSGTPLGINLSTESLCNTRFRNELFELLQGAPEAARQLWLEVPEYGALRHLAEFRALCLALRPLGCKLGIEHVGREFRRIGELHELGLDYIKVDASLVRGIDADAGNQNVLRGLCVVAHAIGLTVIAEGVTSEGERALLPALGLDGMTGPGVTRTETAG